MVNQTSNKIKMNHFDPKSCPNPRLIHFCPKSYPNPGFLLPKRHIFGSEFEKFSFLSLFWTFFDPLKQVYQTWSDIIWGPNREMGTSVQIVISRSRLRNRVKCLIPRPGRWTHTHHNGTNIEFLRSLHNRPFGKNVAALARPDVHLIGSPAGNRP